MMKKSILLVLCVFLLALTLAGCAAGNAGMVGQTKAPVATFTPDNATMAPVTTMQPETTMMPENSPMTTAENDMLNGMASGMNGGAAAGSANAAMTPAEMGRMAEKIADAVERISEIDDAEVIVEGNRALVAVEFEDQYSAGLDDRMKQLITQTVQKADSKITEVSITDDDTLYGQVKSLAERIGKATGLDELTGDIGDLWDRVTGR
ncbi:MAG: YhcN/YlaJ family sporulation lipoprotein [Clostridia bacterium]|nr:YhcN/YlaJ family sporulation lipoprotein [Clostridia bacterium]